MRYRFFIWYSSDNFLVLPRDLSTFSRSASVGSSGSISRMFPLSSMATSFRCSTGRYFVTAYIYRSINSILHFLLKKFVHGGVQSRPFFFQFNKNSFAFLTEHIKLSWPAFCSIPFTG